MHQNWWHQVKNQVKEATQATLIMMNMVMNQIMIWVEKSLARIMEWQKKKKKCKYIVPFVLADILRKTVQTSNIAVPNNLTTLGTTLQMLLHSNKTVISIVDMRIINMSMDKVLGEKIRTIAIIVEVIEITTMIRNVAIVIIVITITTTTISMKKVLNNILAGAHKKELNILISNQPVITVNKIITSNKNKATTIKKVRTAIELTWTWSTFKINRIVILNHTTHIIKEIQVIQNDIMNIDIVDELTTVFVKLKIQMSAMYNKLINK